MVTAKVVRQVVGKRTAAFVVLAAVAFVRIVISVSAVFAFSHGFLPKKIKAGQVTGLNIFLADKI